MSLNTMIHYDDGYLGVVYQYSCKQHAPRGGKGFKYEVLTSLATYFGQLIAGLTFGVAIHVPQRINPTD